MKFVFMKTSFGRTNKKEVEGPGPCVLAVSCLAADTGLPWFGNERLVVFFF